jgi:hypothetical protein
MRRNLLTLLLGRTSRRDMKRRIWRILGNMMRAPHRALWVLLLLPYLIYEFAGIFDDLQEKRWPSLQARGRRLRRAGFNSDDISYWVGVASAKLEQWDDSLREFGSIEKPLDAPADEAARWAFHAWSLYKLGRAQEARSLLQHALEPDWPEARRDWVESFLGGLRPASESESPFDPVH